MTYSRSLASLANDPTLPPGLGPVSVLGGPLQSEGRDLRELFRCVPRPSPPLPKLCLKHLGFRAIQWHLCFTLVLVISSQSFIYLGLLRNSACSGKLHRISPACVWAHDGMAQACRIYLEESLRTNDAFTDQLEDDVADMRTIMGLGTREAADMRSEIVSKSYKCAPPQPEAPLYSIPGCQCQFACQCRESSVVCS